MMLGRKDVITALNGFPIKKESQPAVQFGLQGGGGVGLGILKSYMPNVWMGMFVDVICFSKDLRGPKLLTISAVCQVLLCAMEGAITRFQKLFGIY